MSVLLQDLIDQTSDYCQNFTSSTIDKNSTIRAINRGIEFVKRRLGLPCDLKIFSFYFYEDTKYYDCPSYFDELLEVYYNTSAAVNILTPATGNPNVPERRWNMMKQMEMLRDSGRFNYKNQVAISTLNGKNQLFMLGHNTTGPVILNSFDTTTGLTYSSAIANQVIDTTIFKQGAGSLKFDIGSSAGPDIITIPVSLNLQNALNQATAYRVYIDFPTGTSGYFSNVELRLGSSATDYYSMTTTLQVDGTAWNENSWSQLGFSLANAVTQGSPTSTNITNAYLVFNHSGTFAAATNYRIDNLYQITPDYMDCVYYTGIKGTDTTGVTSKVILTTGTDIVAFGAYAIDLIDTVALLATVRLFPQVRGDTAFWQMYSAGVKDTLALLGRTYPHDRATGRYGQSQLNR